MHVKRSCRRTFQHHGIRGDTCKQESCSRLVKISTVSLVKIIDNRACRTHRRGDYGNRIAGFRGIQPVMIKDFHYLGILKAGNRLHCLIVVHHDYLLSRHVEKAPPRDETYVLICQMGKYRKSPLLTLCKNSLGGFEKHVISYPGRILMHQQGINSNRKAQKPYCLCGILMGDIDKSLVTAQIDLLESVFTHTCQDQAWQICLKCGFYMVKPVPDHKHRLRPAFRQTAAENLVIHCTDHDRGMYHILSAFFQEEAFDDTWNVPEENVIDRSLSGVLPEEIAVDLIN